MTDTTYIVPASNNIDDTQVIQSYLNNGALIKGRILLTSNQTYIITRQGTIGILGIKNRDVYGYCLKIPSNVIFDLNGSTLKLANNQDACIIVNDNPDSNLSGNNNIKITNGILDQNNTNQSNTYYQGGMYLGKVKNSFIENITVKNARMYAFRIMGCENTHFNNLKAINIHGYGFYIGQPIQLPDCPNDLTVRNCTFGLIHAENCISGYFYPQSGISTETVGNSYHITAENCTFETIIDNQTVGGKIAGPSKNLFINKIIADGSPTKLQHNPTFIKINTILSSNTLEAALSLIECQYVQIDQVFADNCGLNFLDGQIIWLNGEEVQINSLIINKGHSKVTTTVKEQSKYLYINNYQSFDCIGELDIRGNVNIINATIIKSSNLSGDYRGIGIYNESAMCNIGNLTISGNYKNQDYIVSASNLFQLKELFLEGFNENGKVVTLNLGTSTTILNTKLLYKNYTKTIMPVLHFIPINSASRAVTINGYSMSNFDLNIYHTTAKGTEKFILVVDNYIGSTAALS